MTDETPKKPVLTVVPFPGARNTTGAEDLTAAQLFESALKADLEEVMVIGATADGRIYLGTLTGYLPDAMWLLKLAERELIDYAFDDDTSE